MVAVAIYALQYADTMQDTFLTCVSPENQGLRIRVDPIPLSPPD